MNRGVLRWFFGKVSVWAKIVAGVFLVGVLGSNSPRSSAISKQGDNLTKNSPTEGARVSTTNTPKEFSSILKVIDGDTVRLEINGKPQVVRLIGVDTPESVDLRKPVQCFASEATKRAKELLIGKKVLLESDPTQGDKDKYNRLLRYIFFEDGTNFNKLMIVGGYAHEYTYQVPYKYMDEFKQAERQAREGGRGLWAVDACLADVSPTVSFKH